MHRLCREPIYFRTSAISLTNYIQIAVVAQLKGSCVTDNFKSQFVGSKYVFCRSYWPRGLRRGTVTFRLLGLCVRISLDKGMSVSCDCYVLLEFSASGLSLVQRSPTECSVSECDREASTPQGLLCHEKKKIVFYSLTPVS